MTALTHDWVHWLAEGLIVWAALVAVILTWLSGSHERRNAKADAELTDCHCRLVDAPHDWANHSDWVS